MFGIDLGTTNTCVAVSTGRTKPTVCNFGGKYTLPSVVTFSDKCFSVGHGAIEQEDRTHPEQTIKCVKRLMGRSWEEIVKNGEDKLVSYTCTQNADGLPQISVDYRGKTRKLPPEFISAMILDHVRRKIEETYAIKKHPNVVITVPAYFSQKQRHATRAAGKIAGMNVLRVVNEPTAGAFAYEIAYGDPDKERKILVYDFGGGTFDVTILNITGTILDVQATCGSSSLGGEDVDYAIQEYVIDRIEEELSSRKGSDGAKKDIENLRKDSARMAKIRTECKRAKENLANSESVKLELSGLFDFKVELNLAVPVLSSVVYDYIDQTKEYVENCLKDAKLECSDIDEVILLGGSTNLRDVRSLIRSMFGSNKTRMNINADHAVALGAAAYAYQASNQKECVELNEYLLLDIVPRTIGVLVKGGTISPFLCKGNKVPASFSKPMFPVSADQDAAEFSIREGEDLENGFDNPEIARLVLENDKFVRDSELTCKFVLDRDYMLEVTVYTNVVKEVLGDAAQESEKVPLEIVGMSFRSVSKYMGTLRSYTALNHVEFGLRTISGYLDAMALYISKLPSKPTTFITNVRTFVDKMRGLDDSRMFGKARDKHIADVDECSSRTSAFVSLVKALSRMQPHINAESVSEDVKSKVDELIKFIMEPDESEEKIRDKATLAESLLRTMKKRKRSP